MKMNNLKVVTDAIVAIALLLAPQTGFTAEPVHKLDTVDSGAGGSGSRLEPLSTTSYPLARSASTLETTREVLIRASAVATGIMATKLTQNPAFGPIVGDRIYLLLDKGGEATGSALGTFLYQTISWTQSTFFSLPSNRFIDMDSISHNIRMNSFSTSMIPGKSYYSSLPETWRSNQSYFGDDIVPTTSEYYNSIRNK